MPVLGALISKFCFEQLGFGEFWSHFQSDLWPDSSCWEIPVGRNILAGELGETGFQRMLEKHLMPSAGRVGRVTHPKKKSFQHIFRKSSPGVGKNKAWSWRWPHDHSTGDLCCFKWKVGTRWKIKAANNQSIPKIQIFNWLKMAICWIIAGIAQQQEWMGFAASLNKNSLRNFYLSSLSCWILNKILPQVPEGVPAPPALSTHM